MEPKSKVSFSLQMHHHQLWSCILPQTECKTFSIWSEIACEDGCFCSVVCETHSHPVTMRSRCCGPLLKRGIITVSLRWRCIHQHLPCHSSAQNVMIPSTSASPPWAHTSSCMSILRERHCDPSMHITSTEVHVWWPYCHIIHIYKQFVLHYCLLASSVNPEMLSTPKFYDRNV